MKPDAFTAVALTYPQYADAPVIAAKAKGDIARRMEKIALENKVPVVRDKVLANVLSVQEIGECVSEDTWQAVAGVFAFIAGLEHASQRGAKQKGEKNGRED